MNEVERFLIYIVVAVAVGSLMALTRYARRSLDRLRSIETLLKAREGGSPAAARADDRLPTDDAALLPSSPDDLEDLARSPLRSRDDQRL